MTLMIAVVLLLALTWWVGKDARQDNRNPR